MTSARATLIGACSSNAGSVTGDDGAAAAGAGRAPGSGGVTSSGTNSAAGTSTATGGRVASGGATPSGGQYASGEAIAGGISSAAGSTAVNQGAGAGTTGSIAGGALAAGGTANRGGAGGIPNGGGAVTGGANAGGAAGKANAGGASTGGLGSGGTILVPCGGYTSSGTATSISLDGTNGAGAQISGSESYITSRGGTLGPIPRYASGRNGAFEAYLPSGSTNYFLRQQVDQSAMGLGGTWNTGNPITGMGDNRWLNHKVSVDVSFESTNTQIGNNYAALGARQQGGSDSHTISGTPYLLKFLSDGSWQFLVGGAAAASGNVVGGAGGVTIAGSKATIDTWHTLGLQVVERNVTAYLHGTTLTTYSDPNPRMSGRVDLASGYYYTRFDNLKIETVDGYVPYYSELLDDLETYDFASPPAAKLVYGGSWSHKNGQGTYNYQRSISSGTTGATLRYAFAGTCLDILGPNDGSAKLEVTVDGQVTDASASTMSSKESYQTFTLRGLAGGAHTVQVKVLSGTLVVDAVGVVAASI